MHLSYPGAAMTPAFPVTHAFDNDPSVYRTVLESTKAIPWKIDWQSMQFTYIGPQIEKLLGWSQTS